MQRYYGNWSCIEQMCADFYINMEELQGCEIIYADYDTPQYEGYAFVIFAKGNELYEVNASHCSCYGLEDQWKPYDNDYEALMARPSVPDQAKENLKKWKEYNAEDTH